MHRNCVGNWLGSRIAVIAIAANATSNTAAVVRIHHRGGVPRGCDLLAEAN
jgi:hypothetical protein